MAQILVSPIFHNQIDELSFLILLQNTAQLLLLTEYYSADVDDDE